NIFSEDGLNLAIDLQFVDRRRRRWSCGCDGEGTRKRRYRGGDREPANGHEAQVRRGTVEGAAI
ncbi:MAG: hypothetical protein WA020_08875, partial [Candidatus Acidiferrales bacterium]